MWILLPRSEELGGVLPAKLARLIVGRALEVLIRWVCWQGIVVSASSRHCIHGISLFHHSSLIRINENHSLLLLLLIRSTLLIVLILLFINWFNWVEPLLLLL